MYALIDTLIKTERSFLKTYFFSDNTLVESAIAEASGKLNKSSRRNVGFFSNDYVGVYRYGPLPITTTQPLTSALQTLLLITNDYFGADCNGIIVNEYQDGKNIIEKHSDSRNHSDAGVVILSYGVTRNFRVFNKANDQKILDLPLKTFEAIHMGGDFQEEFTHDIEQDLTITEPRYSFSFHKYMKLGLYPKKES